LRRNQSSCPSSSLFVLELCQQSDVVRGPCLIWQPCFGVARVLDVRFIWQLQCSCWHQGVGGVQHIVQGALKPLSHVCELQSNTVVTKALNSIMPPWSEVRQAFMPLFLCMHAVHCLHRNACFAVPSQKYAPAFVAAPTF